MLFRLLVSWFLCFMSVLVASAQPDSTQRDDQSNTLTLSAPKVTIHGGIQLWARYNQNNPGTTDPSGVTSSHFEDIAIRRARISVTLNWNDHLFVYTQMGTNNLSFNKGSAKQPIFIHDLWIKTAGNDHKWFIGAGLNGFNGISRLSNISYAKNFMLDNPGFNYPNVEHTDIMARQLGIFGGGYLGPLNYRIALTKPFTYEQAPSLTPGIATEVGSESFAYKGYFYYQLLENEKTSSCYLPMSYLGKRKILNLGAGFDVHPKSIQYLPENDEGYTIQSRYTMAFDVFLEHPLQNNHFINAYLAGYAYDYGPNFLRAGGIMNIGQMTDADRAVFPQGPGNAHYVFGTGKVLYFSSGLGMATASKSIWQPTFGFTYKELEGLADNSFSVDIGLNYFQQSHQLKYSLQFSNRPVYKAQGMELVLESYKGLAIMQVQIYL
ncbi:hypothetical protein C9994_07180 [Marivirga lumbricoides]|uniref:Porin n=1 Tax=Marivirga lumbricoides TaxID=1046115 RepID=A0A2T4DRR3_9BACT|nr:hypothetical protein C9994_07180 [Marivirga lumbricoides]